VERQNRRSGFGGDRVPSDGWRVQVLGSSKHLLGIGVAGLLGLASSEAFAQQMPTTCITGPASVPGLTGAPNWFGTEPASTVNQTGSRPDIDDPRWASAPLMPFDGTMSSSSPTYRILKYENYLYVSFHAPVGSTGTDAIFFGFSEGPAATKPAYLIEIHPALSEGAPDPLPTPVGHIQIFSPSNNSWSQASTPGWLQDVRTWRSPETGLAFGVNFRIAYKTSGTSDNSSAATAKVVLSRTQPFRTFFGMGIKVEPEFTLEYTTPVFSPLVTNFVNTGIHVPADISLWAPYDGINSACREGVTLDSQNIRTGHPDGSSLYTTGPNSQNTFSIQPQNIRGNVPQFGEHVVRVQLSLSDWGAVPLNAQAAWNPIAGSERGHMTSGIWTWAWNTPGGPPINTLGSATIGFTCAKQGSDSFCPRVTIPPGVPPSSVASQAILASLLPDPNTNNSGILRFKRPSAVLNTAFVGLSEARRMATISTNGLPAPKGTHHDVYLLIVRRNMPPHENQPMTLPLSEMARLRDLVQKPSSSPFRFEDEEEPATAAPGAVVTRDALASDQPATPSSERETTARATVLSALPSPLPAEYSSATHHEILSRVWPVYEVHTFYETGDSRDEDGVTRKILRPLMPFGYLLHHEGPFYGFSDQLEALDGAELTQVEPDLYHASIPVDGSIRIRSTLRAEEEPPRVLERRERSSGCSHGSEPARGSGLALLGVLALCVLRRRRPPDKFPTLS
jgi:MYXO-CTERM domain-containing protein